MEKSIGLWAASLASLTVVTAARDGATVNLARRAGAELHVTDAFWLDGALFNKGRAVQEARSRLPAGDWHLFLDADVVPPIDWLTQLKTFDPKPGTLYGARRFYVDWRPVPDPELAGFFQLFHSGDPRATTPLATNFYHAGNYDSDFISRWPAELQVILALPLLHLGEPRQNWCGKGNDEAMAELRRRRREGHSWRLETIKR